MGLFTSIEVEELKVKLAAAEDQARGMRVLAGKLIRDSDRAVDLVNTVIRHIREGKFDRAEQDYEEYLEFQYSYHDVKTF